MTVSQIEKLAFWDFQDTLRLKCFDFFRAKLTVFLQTRDRNRYNFKTAEGRNLKFRTEMGTFGTTLCKSGGNRSRDMGFQAKKTEIPNGGSNRC